MPIAGKSNQGPLKGTLYSADGPAGQVRLPRVEPDIAGVRLCGEPQGLGGTVPQVTTLAATVADQLLSL